MTSDQLQSQLNETWYREQSADDAHGAIWGEPFDGATVRISDITRIIDKPDYTNPEGMVRRLREILQANAKVEAPHQRDRQNGKLLIEALAEIEALTKRFTKLDKPKYSGDPMLDAVLETTNEDFRAWVDSLPPTYWGRYDLSAARIGWEAASKFILENSGKILFCISSCNVWGETLS